MRQFSPRTNRRVRRLARINEFNFSVSLVRGHDSCSDCGAAVPAALRFKACSVTQSYYKSAAETAAPQWKKRKALQLKFIPWEAKKDRWPQQRHMMVMTGGMSTLSSVATPSVSSSVRSSH